MPTYVTMADMNARLPGAFLIQALDDDGDGAADAQVWADIAASVAKEIDGILGLRYAVPFSGDIPPFVLYAAQILAAALLYSRRGVEDKSNPWTSEAKDIRAKLKEIADGKVPLSPTHERVQATVDTLSEPSKTHSKNLRIAV
jgi:phage gp36-like protein